MAEYHNLLVLGNKLLGQTLRLFLVAMAVGQDFAHAFDLASSEGLFNQLL